MFCRGFRAHILDVGVKNSSPQRTMFGSAPCVHTAGYRMVNRIPGSSFRWVPNLSAFTALDKMTIVYDWPAGRFEPITFDAVFDVASLVLYGTQAIPLRLHICLYRLLCTLESHEDGIRIAGVFGWPWDDIVRGHKLDVSLT